jgi:hypothetical protein
MFCLQRVQGLHQASAIVSPVLKLLGATKALNWWSDFLTHEQHRSRAWNGAESIEQNQEPVLQNPS